MRIVSPVVAGAVAFAALFALYLGLLTAVSGWAFTVDQLEAYWPFILALAAGFGLQIGLYSRLKQVVAAVSAHRTVVAASGTTSTVAMVSCCAHYLTSVLPIVGASGLAALAAQYQVELFWLGLAASAAGTAFVATRLVRAMREHARCAVAS
jgi:Cu+-exporting ATPase